MPKRKRGIKQVFVPVFAVAIITVPAMTGFAVGASALPDLSKILSQNRDERSSTRDGSNRTTDSKNTTAKANNSKTQKQQTVKQPIQTQNQADTLKPDTEKATQTATTKPKQSVALTASKTVTEDTPMATNTSAAATQLAVNQSIKKTQPVKYQTAKISTDQRNDLLQVSLFIAAASASLYALSYAGVLWRLFYGEPVPARRTVAQ